MVPTYYFPVEFMPHTSSGKIDRKLLREHAHALSHEELLLYSASTERVFRDCSNDTERRVRLLWANILNLEREKISLDDNFYDLGGDSIRIITLMKHLRDEFKFNLSLSQMNSRNTTIEGMAKLIISQNMEKKSLNLYGEIQSTLQSDWAQMTKSQDFTFTTALRDDATVFLTGGTGFLGTQLLRQLLGSSQVKTIVALVRAATSHHGLERLKHSATIAGWWDDSVASRVEVWAGDLASEHFGLAGDKWQRLSGQAEAGNIDAIVHNGAVVNWNADYEKLRPTNVQSVVTLLEASVKSPRTPKFVFISGGSNFNPADDQRIIAEQMAADIGYSQTKYVAESIVHQITTQMPPCQNRFSVVKPGLVIGTSDEGISNIDDFIWRLVAASTQLKLCPSKSSEWLGVGDAGFVASQILGQISQSKIAAYNDLSVRSGLPTRKFWELVNYGLKHPCTGLTWNDWIKHALEDMNTVGERHPLWPVQHFLVEETTPMPRRPITGGSENLHSAIINSVRYLQRIGFVQGGLEKSAEITEDVFRRQ